MVNEIGAAEAAGAEANRWRTEIRLIDQALTEIEADIAAVGSSRLPPGIALPPVPITDVSVDLDPVARVRFRIGMAAFAYAEEIDWAERGSQLARSELIREAGNFESAVPAGLAPDESDRLRDHLGQSVFVFATDLRDRALNQESMPSATLADLAKPGNEFGGWLDWSGQSMIGARQEIERNQLMAECERLLAERNQLLDEESKAAGKLPFARRRLAEIDKEIAAATADK